MKLRNAGLGLVGLMFSLSCQKKESRDPVRPTESFDVQLDQEGQAIDGNPSQNISNEGEATPTQSAEVPKGDKTNDEGDHHGSGGETVVNTDPSGLVRLVSALSNACIFVDKYSSENMAVIKTGPCENVEAQQWSLVPSQKDTFKLANALSKKCLDVFEVSVLDSATIGQYSCVGSAPCQDTYVTPSRNGNGAQNFAFLHSGKCLEVRGSEVRQSACDGSLKQDWYFR